FAFALLGLGWAFWQATLLLLAIAALFAFWAHLSPEHCGLSPPDDGEPRPAPVAPTAAEAPDSERNSIRFLIALGLLYFSFKFLRYALDSWVPLIVEDHFGRSTFVAAYVSTAYDWLGFAGVLFAGVVSDRYFGARRSPVIFLLTGLCLI